MRSSYLYSQGGLSDTAISQNRDSPAVHNATRLVDQAGIGQEAGAGYAPVGLIQNVKTKVQKSGVQDQPTDVEGVEAAYEEGK